MLAFMSPEQMSVTVRQLMIDESFRHMHASAATLTAALQSAGFEVAHDLRRVLLRILRRGERMNTAIKTPGDGHDL